MNSFEPLFYLGVGSILLFFILLLYMRFGTDSQIDFRRHLWILLLYLLLLVGSIWAWRYVYDFFFSQELFDLLKREAIEDYDG